MLNLTFTLLTILSIIVLFLVEIPRSTIGIKIFWYLIKTVSILGIVISFIYWLQYFSFLQNVINF